MKKIIIFLLLVSFSVHAGDSEVGPVGPQSTTPTSIGEEQTENEKPKVDLPYKPKTEEQKPTTVDAPVIKKQIVVEPVPSIPSKSPEPSLPPDPKLD